MRVPTVQNWLVRVGCFRTVAAMEPKHTILCSVCGRRAGEHAHFCERFGRG
jgi:hypothetical protein